MLASPIPSKATKETISSRILTYTPIPRRPSRCIQSIIITTKHLNHGTSPWLLPLYYNIVIILGYTNLCEQIIGEMYNESVVEMLGDSAWLFILFEKNLFDR